MDNNTRQLTISTGDRVNSAKWTVKQVSFESLCEKLSTTIVTEETVEEYHSLISTNKTKYKDYGGFVGGKLKESARSKESVEFRSMLTLDAEHVEESFLDKVKAYNEYKLFLYTTHGHTPTNPRARIIFPLLRDVSGDEYNAIARLVAAKLGINNFDTVSYRANQLMFWPSTPKDGEFISFGNATETWLDPDSFLASYPDWKNIAILPKSDKETPYRGQGKHAADPLKKKGIVGAFCRTYTIQEAIEEFLSDVYEPSCIEGRYDYKPADSFAGVLVYDDKFSYSHHASDPACQRLCNAFDLVRIHKFGNLDTDPEIAIERQPSFKAMLEFAQSIPKVKQAIVEEKIQQASEDFEDDENWVQKLKLTKKGEIEDTLENLVLILSNDPKLKGLAFNSHRDGIDAKGELPWSQLKCGWSDNDFSCLKVYLAKAYKIYSPAKTKDALNAVMVERKYHPIKEYLLNLPNWDGYKRVESLFIDYFGAEDSAYTRSVSRKAMLAAVARIFEPGIKFDSVPILYGPQGIGKSTFFSKLAGQWFSDSLTLSDMKDKTGPEKLQGYWILELGELAGMRKIDVETVKSFLSRTDDKYRASYGLNVESHPRQCIIVGSTNAEMGFLRDISGNRRFWPIKVTGASSKKAWQMTKYEVDQIWAETLVLYEKHEPLYMEGDVAILATEAQDTAMETDERQGMIEKYLDMYLPSDWDSMDLGSRRFYIDTYDSDNLRKDVKQRMYVSNLEIWSECFGKDPTQLKPADSYALAAIIRKINNWDKKGNFKMLSIYGKQRVYERTDQK